MATLWCSFQVARLNGMPDSSLGRASRYRGRGFKSYSGHFHSHKLSRLIFKILLLVKYTLLLIFTIFLSSVLIKDWNFSQLKSLKFNMMFLI